MILGREQGYNIHISSEAEDLVWFICLMVYQLIWVIWCQNDSFVNVWLIITIFSMFHYIFFLSVISICQESFVCRLLWYQLFLSNANNLNTVKWYQVFLTLIIQLNNNDNNNHLFTQLVRVDLGVMAMKGWLHTS